MSMYQTRTTPLAGNYASASVSHTFTAAGSFSATATLANGAVGKPKRVRVSGNVSGEVDIQIQNTQVIVIPVNPNAPFTEVDLPDFAFPKNIGQVALTLVADAAGTIRAIVDFVI
jgi:hypothetical protein